MPLGLTFPAGYRHRQAHEIIKDGKTEGLKFWCYGQGFCNPSRLLQICTSAFEPTGVGGWGDVLLLYVMLKTLSTCSYKYALRQPRSAKHVLPRSPRHLRLQSLENPRPAPCDPAQEQDAQESLTKLLQRLGTSSPGRRT